MNISLNLYHIFYTVAEHGNLSIAAKKLFISQPAVSKSICRLEEELHTTLFIRSSKGVTLTENGEILYRQLDTAFHAIKQGETEILKNEALGVGSLSIGVSSTLCKYVLLPYLNSFIQQFPHIRISISCQSSFETIAALENGSLDIGLVGEPDRLNKVHFLPIQEINDIFVTTSEYQKHLMERLSLSNMAEQELLSSATIMLLNKKNITRQYIEKYMILQDIAFDQLIEVSSMDLLIDFAKIGLGIACVIQEFVESELKEGTLVPFPLKNPIPPRNIGLIYSQKPDIHSNVSKFVSLFQPTISADSK